MAARDLPMALGGAQSEIVVAPGDFPDDLTTPDHRSPRAVLTTAGGPQASPALVLPTVTAPPSPTAVPQAACPRATTNANLRGGPGTSYPVVGSLRSGECVEITGRTVTGDWYQLASGAWVAAFRRCSGRGCGARSGRAHAGPDRHARIVASPGISTCRGAGDPT